MNVLQGYFKVDCVIRFYDDCTKTDVVSKVVVSLPNGGDSTISSMNNKFCIMKPRLQSFNLWQVSLKPRSPSNPSLPILNTIPLKVPRNLTLSATSIVCSGARAVSMHSERARACDLCGISKKCSCCDPPWSSHLRSSYR
ncbi:hypothetical protein JHK87_050561 [Glycine soja]|nr:hypothetical protein JHK87_050561 [Glycine soja]